MIPQSIFLYFFFFNDTATTEIYTLSLHDALPIFHPLRLEERGDRVAIQFETVGGLRGAVAESDALVAVDHEDRKSTRLNSSHSQISYAVFCLKKKKHCRTVRHMACGGASQRRQ